MFPSGSLLKPWSPAGGTILGGSRNFRLQDEGHRRHVFGACISLSLSLYFPAPLRWSTLLLSAMVLYLNHSQETAEPASHRLKPWTKQILPPLRNGFCQVFCHSNEIANNFFLNKFSRCQQLGQHIPLPPSPSPWVWLNFAARKTTGGWSLPKVVAASILVAGPVSWGWGGYQWVASRRERLQYLVLGSAYWVYVFITHLPVP
jgi:hypothetical protein